MCRTKKVCKVYKVCKVESLKRSICKSETRNLEPETLNPKLRTQNFKPETLNPKL